MAFQRVPFTVKVSIEGVTQNVPIVETHYAQKAGGYTQSDLVTLANAVDLYMSSVRLPGMSNEYQYLQTRVLGLDSQNDYEVIDTSSAGAGGVANEAYNPTVALAVQRLTGLTGRSARGRVFFGPLRANMVSADSTRVSQATADGIVSFMTQLMSTMATAGFTEVVVQRFAEGLQLPEAVVRPVIAWAVSDLVLDNQRRRKPRIE